MQGSSALTHPVILTRAGAVNQRLGLRFERAGAKVMLWPAFRIRLPENEALVAERFADLSDVELVLLVSPASVSAVAHWVDKWPSHITLATVGEGTARVARAAWGPDVPIIYPPGDAAHTGSEALMAELRKRGIPSRVLICRGQTGREWLSEELIAAGADVQKLACYERIPLELSPQQLTELALAVEEGEPPVVYITTSEAVDTLMHALHEVPKAWSWLLSGTALVIHPRSEKRAREAGFRRIMMCSPKDEDVVAAALAAMKDMDA